MEKKRIILIVVAVLFISALLLFVFSAEISITITKPLNQSYNYNNHTINVTTGNSASTCLFVVNAPTQGQSWRQLTSSASWSAREAHGLQVSPNGTIWLVGGYNGVSTFYSDVWYSTDGNAWTQATGSANWAPRMGHGFVIRSDGSLWIYGGYGSGGIYFNDVWNSTNGVTWTLVNSSVAWENRSYGQAFVTSDNVLWIIGGENSTTSGNNKKGDVWNSSNGADWRLVNGTAFSGRRDFAAAIGNNGRFWIFGGTNSDSVSTNDVWYSDDKINWIAGNTTAVPWGPRNSHSAVYTSSDNRIWIFGGYNLSSSSRVNDAWYTRNGENWTQAASSVEWAARQDHRTAIMGNGTLILAGGFTGSSLNDIYLSAVRILMNGSGTDWGKEFNASDGGTFISVECKSIPNGAETWNTTNVSFYVDTQTPVITISNPLNITYNASSMPVAANATASETASSCLSSLNGAANITMDGSGTAWGKGFTSAEGSNTIVVSCNDTVNNRNSTSIAFFMDSIKPVITITKPLNQTYTTTSLTVNATTNESASICRYAHNTSGLDENWTRLNASSAFSARQGHTIVKSSNGTMWLIGGSYPFCTDVCGYTFYLNDTWYSTNGVTWTRANASTAFAGRAYHTSVATSDGKIWVIGGFDGTNYYNDTWYSTDGVNWIRANASAFPGRYGHTSVVDSTGKIWVIAGYISGAGADPPQMGMSSNITIMGGGDGSPVPTNTTWYSTDGFSWRQANASAFPARYKHASAATSDGKVWVTGGINTAGSSLNDVWYSADSASWVRANSSAAWAARYSHMSFASSDNRIWLMGGTTTESDLWYSSNGADWVYVNASSWNARYDSAAAVKNNYIYMAGGIGADAILLNDSWSSPVPPRYIGMDGSGTAWGKNFTASIGSNDVRVRCYDTAGNLNSSIVWFSVNLCGNNVCDAGETTASCSGDCPASAASTGASTALTGGAAEKTTAEFTNLKAGVETEKQLLDQKTAFTKIAITANEDVKSVKLTIEKKEAVPEGVKEPADKVYQLIDIKLEADAELKAKLCFSVEEEWLKEKEVEKEDVVLAHYKPRIVYKLKPGVLSSNEMTLSFAAEEEEWEELPTQIVKEEALEEQKKKVDYCVEATQFSMYAIIAKKPEIEEFITVIQPVVEEQILEPRKKPIPPRGIDLWRWRIPITAVADIILIMGLVSLIAYGRRFEEFMPEIIEQPMPSPVALKKEFKAPESTMIEFARNSLLQGYAETDIISSMAAKNISNDAICTAVKKAYTSICRMSEHELVPHVTDLVMRGYSEAEIKGMLMKNGISAGCVYSAIKAARRHISKASASAVLPFVQKCIYSGIDDNKIKEMLVKHGIREKRASDFIKMAHNIRKEKSLNH